MILLGLFVGAVIKSVKPNKRREHSIANGAYVMDNCEPHQVTEALKAGWRGVISWRIAALPRFPDNRGNGLGQLSEDSVGSWV